MTFQEAIERIRKPDWRATPELLAIIEQVEANRKAIESLAKPGHMRDEEPLGQASFGPDVNIQ